jgi:hypothetical protein
MMNVLTRRTGLGLAAALAAVLAVGGLQATALSASAAEHPTIDFSVTSGDDVAIFNTPNADAVSYHTDFSCGAGNKMDLFVTPAGTESVAVPADVTADFTSTAFAASTFKGPQVDENGSMIRQSQTFPSTMLRAGGFSPIQMSQLLSPSGSYSFGIYCIDAAGVVVPDAVGNVLVAFTTLDVDANGGWKVAVPKTDTTTTLTAAQQGSSDALLTATVAPAEATGTVDFFENDTKVGSGPVSNGVATATVSGVADGLHSYTANYVPAADSNFAESTSEAASVTISKVKVATTVELTGTASGYDAINFSATVKSPSATASDATGTVEFWSAGSKMGVGDVANGVATFAATGLTDGQSYSYTAKYVPAAEEANYAASAESAAVSVAIPALPKELKDGDSIAAGGTYRVEFLKDTFEAGTTLTGVVHSDPITLDETAAVAADGSARYIFTAPAALVAGSSHELEVTDGTTTVTIAFSVTTPPPADDNGDNNNGGGANNNNGDSTIPKTGNNDPASFATDWIGAAGNNPLGLAAIIGSLLAAAAGATAGSVLLWRRRKQA